MKKCSHFLSITLWAFVLCSCVTPVKVTDSAADPDLVDELGASCMTEFGEVPGGGSYVAYKEPFVASGQTCESEVRVCTQGKLSGQYTFISCFEGAPIGLEESTSVVIPQLAPVTEEPNAPQD